MGSPLIWVHTLMCLILLFHFAAPGLSFTVGDHRPRILHRLQEVFGVHPDDLHYSLFEKPNTVYCMFQVDFDCSRFRTGYHRPSSLLYVRTSSRGATLSAGRVGKLYVGGTAVGAAKRHLTGDSRRLSLWMLSYH